MTRIIVLTLVVFSLSIGWAQAGETKATKADAVTQAKIKKAAPAKQKAAIQVLGNTVCPVSGKPVGGSPSAPNFYSDHNGYRIGFMCPVCKGKFDSADTAKKDEYLKKAQAGPKVETGK